MSEWAIVLLTAWGVIAAVLTVLSVSDYGRSVTQEARTYYARMILLSWAWPIYFLSLLRYVPAIVKQVITDARGGSNG